MKNRILKAFWHRGRKKFLPWTLNEIAKRSDMYPDQTLDALRGLAVAGLAQSKSTTRGKRSDATWQLTPAGQAEAANIITAEAFIKDGNA